MASKIVNKDLSAGRKPLKYDPTSADVDFVAVGGEPIRYFYKLAAGTIVLTNNEGDTVTFADAEISVGGPPIVGMFSTMSDTSTCTSILVAW